MKLVPTPFFDPDRNVFAEDKLEHFAAMLVLAFLLRILFLPPAVLLICFLVACAFEMGQFDLARQVPAFHDDAPVGSLVRPFRPGYGFGLLDVAAGMTGALVGILLRLVV